MLKGAPNWGVRTGFFFACTGLIVVVIAWFIVPETARVGLSSLQIIETRTDGSANSSRN